MQKIEIYEPNKFLKLGLGVWPCMVQELWEARELIWRLFLRNFAARYKQSLLGYAWAVIMPLFAVATFVFLKKAGVILIGETGVPYVIFALAGLAVFQLFSSGLAAGCTALVEAGDMIAKVNFPREVLVIAAMAGAVFEFVVKIILLLGVCAFLHFIPPFSALLSLAAIIPMILLTMGLALFFSLVHAVFRDTAQAVSVAAMFLMFLTPVLYPAKGPHAWIFRLNPLTGLVDGPRDLFIYGQMKGTMDFALASVLALLVFLVGWRVFHMVETKIPERI